MSHNGTIFSGSRCFTRELSCIEALSIELSSSSSFAPRQLQISEETLCAARGVSVLPVALSPSLPARRTSSPLSLLLPSAEPPFSKTLNCFRSCKLSEHWNLNTPAHRYKQILELTNFLVRTSALKNRSNVLWNTSY